MSEIPEQLPPGDPVPPPPLRERHPERRIGLFVIGFVVIIGALVAGIILANNARSLNYTLVFENADNLQPGDKVQLNGVDIGTVKSVELGDAAQKIAVEVKVDPKHAEQVRSDSTGMISSVSFPNVSGQKVVEIVNPQNEEPVGPMQDGAIVEGLDGEIDKKTWQVKQLITGGVDLLRENITALSETVDHLTREVSRLADSPESKQAIEKLSAFAQELARSGRGTAQKVREEWPEVQKEVDPLIDEMMRLGQDTLVRELRRMMGEIDRTVNELEREAAPAN